MEQFSIKKHVGELIGTFALVLVGVLTALFSGGGALMVSLAFGLTLVAMITVFGGHFNPAVSLAAAIDKRITWVEFATYSVSQILGGVLAAVVVLVVKGSGASFAPTAFVPLVVLQGGDETKAALLALLVETIVTFLFVLVTLRATATEEGKRHAPIVIGLAFAVLVGATLGLTGGSLNPARSIGPALFQGGKALEIVWVYIAGPLLGGGLAALANKAL